MSKFKYESLTTEPKPKSKSKKPDSSASPGLESYNLQLCPIGYEVLRCACMCVRRLCMPARNVETSRNFLYNNPQWLDMIIAESDAATQLTTPDA